MSNKVKIVSGFKGTDYNYFIDSEGRVWTQDWKREFTASGDHVWKQVEMPEEPSDANN